MKKTENPLQNIRWIALSFALTLVLGIGSFSIVHRTAAPKISGATMTSQGLLADDGSGQETHGGKGHGGKRSQHLA